MQQGAHGALPRHHEGGIPEGVRLLYPDVRPFCGITERSRRCSRPVGARAGSRISSSPPGGVQGRGIFLTRSLGDVEDLGTVCVAQPYVADPLLIDLGYTYW
jgi:hypothetical protein